MRKQLFLISIGVIAASLALMQKQQVFPDNHLEYYVLPPVYPYAGTTTFIASDGPEIRIAHWHTISGGTWRDASPTKLYCAVCRKDLLFSILWGSSITPPKS